MGNSFARRNMWDSDYRPEQLFTRDFLAKLHPDWVIRTEYPVRNLTLDGEKRPSCTLDLAIPSEKIAIRLNGGYHFASARQELKDELQKECLIQAGWIVWDFDDYKMINLFKKKKSEKTVKLAEQEIEDYIGKV